MNTGIVGQLPSKGGNITISDNQGEHEIPYRDVFMKRSGSLKRQNDQQQIRQCLQINRSRKLEIFKSLHLNNHGRICPQKFVTIRQLAISSKSPKNRHGAKLEDRFSSIYPSLRNISQINEQYYSPCGYHQEQTKSLVWQKIEQITSSMTYQFERINIIQNKFFEGFNLEEFVGVNHRGISEDGKNEDNRKRQSSGNCDSGLEGEIMDIDQQKFSFLVNKNQYIEIEKASQLSQQLELNLSQINNPRTTRFNSVQTARNINQNIQLSGSEGNLTDRSIIFVRNNIPNILEYQDGLNIKEECIQLGQYYEVVKQRDTQYQIIENYQNCRQQYQEAMKLKNQEIKELKDQLESKERQLQDEKRQHALKENKLKKISQQYQQANSLVSYYAKLVDSNSQTINQKQQQINKNSSEHQHQLAQLYKTINKLEHKLQSEQHNFEQKVETIHQEYYQLNEENIQIKQMFMEAEGENRRVKRENDELRDKIEGINQEIANKQSIKDNSQYYNYLVEVEKFNQLLNQKDQLLRSYQKKLKTLTIQQENLLAMSEQAQKQLKQLRQQRIKDACQIIDKQKQIHRITSLNKSIKKRQESSHK